ncbi:putative ATPase with chaperone activity [Azospirillum soli]|nr:putative ATPase with chaperone activity [Azospirillum soli]
MVARIKTVAFQGIEVLDIDVQVQMSGGIVAFTVVGLPDKAVAESRERVRAALHALGLALPAKRITVNLAPADVLKEGSHFDLPIALALLTVMGVLPDIEMQRYCALGELALDGALTPVAGVLPAAINALAQDRGLICPEGCGGEAAWAGDGLDVIAPANLLSLINHFKGTQVLTRPKPRIREDDEGARLDLRDVKGNETAAWWRRRTQQVGEGEPAPL